MSVAPLREVFGISTDIPKYTYVDRQKLDQRFQYYLGSQKHIVVHGASKQGKSCLRKKMIDDANCLIVQCLPAMTKGEEVWRTALRNAGVERMTRSSSSKEFASQVEGEVEGQGGLPLVASVKGKVAGTVKSGDSEVRESSPIGSDSLLPELAEFLRENNKRLIIEDFHYLPDHVRQEVAFGLKALYEESAYVVIVGIWSEQNLITYYNGDLTGRIEEINLTWNKNELSQVLSQGEGALNIEFAPGLRNQLIESAFENVGLLQRLAEKVCLEADVLESQPAKKDLSDITFLNTARQQLVTDIRQRYLNIADVFKASMRSDAVLLLYARIYNELIDASDEQLIKGIEYPVLFNRIEQHAQSVTIRQSDLTSALDKVERLQARKGVTPLLVSYSKNLRKLFLFEVGFFCFELRL
ncbi:MAG: hypothetical protein AAB588_06320 [Patescibacteria group bacterium]